MVVLAWRPTADSPISVVVFAKNEGDGRGDREREEHIDRFRHPRCDRKATAQAAHLASRRKLRNLLQQIAIRASDDIHVLIRSHSENNRMLENENLVLNTFPSRCAITALLLPRPFRSASTLDALQNTICSRTPRIVAIPMLFRLAINGTPMGPGVVPMVIFSFCAPLTTCISGVSCSHGVIAML
jgi:hypothetical protein